jgi:hypothetical protein
MPDLYGRPACPVRGCPVRYRGGPDRLCPDHVDEPVRDPAAEAWRERLDALMGAPGGLLAATGSAAEDPGQ